MSWLCISFPSSAYYGIKKDGGFDSTRVLFLFSKVVQHLFSLLVCSFLFILVICSLPFRSTSSIFFCPFHITVDIQFYPYGFFPYPLLSLMYTLTFLTYFSCFNREWELRFDFHTLETALSIPYEYSCTFLYFTVYLINKCIHFLFSRK